MMTIGMTSDRDRMLAQPTRSGSRVRQVLLLCGILSSVLYIATDVLGGMRYPGYSFTSQAVSELMATGAPSEPFVDPLFIVFGVLALAFGVGVFREGAGGSRALRVTGALLAAYAAIGFTGPTLFEMHPRGAGTPNGDTSHIILTAVLVLLQLVAIGIAAFALGKRFRLYSLAMLVTVIVFGVLSAPYGARLAAGQPTPGFGIVERILIYSTLLWVAVFAIALLRRQWYGNAAGARLTATARVEGIETPHQPSRTRWWTGKLIAPPSAEASDVGNRVSSGLGARVWDDRLPRTSPIRASLPRAQERAARADRARWPAGSPRANRVHRRSDGRRSGAHVGGESVHGEAAR